MKKFQDYLEMDGGIAFNLAIFKRFSSIGDSCYAEICGSYIEGVYQWSDHNISHVNDSENDKYYGYTIFTNCGASRRVYIEKWVLALTPKDWNHAKCLFHKFLKEDIKYNNSESAKSQHYYY